MPEPNAPNAAGRYEDALLTKFIASPSLTEGWKGKGHFNDGGFDGGIDPIFEDQLTMADFLQMTMGFCAIAPYILGEQRTTKSPYNHCLQVGQYARMTIIKPTNRKLLKVGQHSRIPSFHPGKSLRKGVGQHGPEST